MNIGSEDEWIIQLLQNLDFYSPVSEVYWFYDCVQRRSNTKCSYNISADITNSLPASTGGTEGQKAKNKNSQRHWEPKHPVGRWVRTGATQSTCSSTQVKFNFGDQTRLCCWPITSHLIGRRAGGSKTEKLLHLISEDGTTSHSWHTEDGLAQNIWSEQSVCCRRAGPPVRAQINGRGWIWLHNCDLTHRHVTGF